MNSRCLLMFASALHIHIPVAQGWFLRPTTEGLHLQHAVPSAGAPVAETGWPSIAGSLLPNVQFMQQPVSDAEGNGKGAPLDEVKDPAREVEKETQAGVEKAVESNMPPPATPSPEVAKEMDAAADSAADLTGLEIDKPGDMESVAFAFFVNSSVVVVCALVFTLLRMKYPVMYSGNAIAGFAPTVEGFESGFGWFRASFSVPTETAADTIGLDNALLIEFCNMCMKILGIIGLPLIMVMAPLHYFCGGGSIHSGSIRLFSMANVMDGHPWMYYVHAIVVNFVTLVIVRVTHDAMVCFMRLRCRWLKKMPSPRCTTILVEGIPPEWSSDAKLRVFFETCLTPGAVVDATVVKNSPTLERLVNEEARYKELLHQAKAELRGMAENELPETRPLVSDWLCCGPQVDAITHYEEKLEEFNKHVSIERDAVLKLSETVSGVNRHTGFVTFANRRQAEIAKDLSFGSYSSEWVVSTPPPAADIRWADLKSPAHTRLTAAALGYAMLVALYILFVPICALTTNLAKVVNFGPFQSVWESFAPGLSLIIFLGFLPTVMLLIFRTCFFLKADAYAQHKLQLWYFYFMVFFVILVTAIGTSLVETIARVLRRPELAITLMAENLPGATKFYVDYMMLQWATHGMQFTRYVTVLKFLAFSSYYEPEDAKKMAEPEDQDFYGIGSRSARFTVNAVIGIVFSTLSPLIAVLTFINFLICRIFYGYLLVFAEVKKPDLGGIFFVTQIKHVLVGTLIYDGLMIGVLFFRASSKAPMIMAMPSLAYSFYTFRHFNAEYLWEQLPFKEVCFNEEDFEAVDNGMHYIQPEFVPTKKDFEADNGMPDFVPTRKTPKQ